MFEEPHRTVESAVTIGGDKILDVETSAVYAASLK
jgi:hypothetical protein